MAPIGALRNGRGAEEPGRKGVEATREKTAVTPP